MNGLPRRAAAGRALALAVALGPGLLAACGKRGDPVPAGPDEAVTFPRTYPREDGVGPAVDGPESVFPRTGRGIR